LRPEQSVFLKTPECERSSRKEKTNLETEPKDAFFPKEKTIKSEHGVAEKTPVPWENPKYLVFG